MSRYRDEDKERKKERKKERTKKVLKYIYVSIHPIHVISLHEVQILGDISQ